MLLRWFSRVPAPLALLAAAACTGLSAPAVPPGPAFPPERFALAGAVVAVYDIAGEVRLEPGAGPDVVVTVTRVGRDAAALRIRRERRPGGEALWLRVPGPAGRRILYPRLAGIADSIHLHLSHKGLQPGKGGFLGCWVSPTATTIMREPAGGALDAHADVVVAVPPGRRVDVQLGAGHLLVGPVAGEVRALQIAGRMQATNPGGVVRLTSASGGVSVNGGTGALAIHTRKGSIGAIAFRGARLDASTGAGSIVLRNASAGMLALRTDAGNITLERVGARTLRARSDAGRQRLADVTADTLLVRSGIGSLALQRVRALTASIEAGKGNVYLDLLAVPTLLRLRANGLAVLALPAGAGADLALKSDDGRLTLQLRPSLTARRGDWLLVRVGRGGGTIQACAEHGVIVREAPLPPTPAAAPIPHR